MRPVTYTLPAASTATPRPSSSHVSPTFAIQSRAPAALSLRHERVGVPCGSRGRPRSDHVHVAVAVDRDIPARVFAAPPR